MSTVPHRTMTTVLTLVVPGALLGSTLAVAAAWSDQLPDPVASHFGSEGPTGYSSLAGLLWPTVAVSALVAVGSWVLAFFWGRAALVRRVAAGTAVGVSAVMATIVIGILDAQRGLTDAADTGDIAVVTVVALVVGALAATLAAVAMPGDPHQPAGQAVPDDAPRLALGAGETATWVAVAASRAMLVGGWAAAAFVLVVSVLTQKWSLALASLALVVVVLATARFTVVVDRRGFTVRSALGWPRVVVPLDEVLRAEVVQVAAVSEFGGWGYRVGRGGRVGIVLRSGEALQVERTGERSLVVTVHDAATAAALLNTLAARSRVL
ncbi:DUF1648 domain-containing protein [Cellulomonas sp. URHD0024]|uniref:DUF1648 domain-containing protein n=1 Tax=Cellulomonas sp. URHD0024 TaxID=1302620 RepID=UPI00041B9029|nr:DUF1648 domain-containing protein [Cellulomonas sp. URHD0024]